MKKLELILQNIKCDGCVNSIKNVLEKHSNIASVEVIKETGSVIISGKEIDKKSISSELTTLGYPEIKKGIFSKIFSPSIN